MKSAEESEHNVRQGVVPETSRLFHMRPNNVRRCNREETLQVYYNQLQDQQTAGEILRHIGGQCPRIAELYFETMTRKAVLASLREHTPREVNDLRLTSPGVVRVMSDCGLDVGGNNNGGNNNGRNNVNDIGNAAQEAPHRLTNSVPTCACGKKCLDGPGCAFWEMVNE